VKVFAITLIVIGVISIWLATLMAVNTGDVGGHVMFIGGGLLILIGTRYIRKMNT